MTFKSKQILLESKWTFGASFLQVFLTYCIPEDKWTQLWLLQAKRHENKILDGKWPQTTLVISTVNILKQYIYIPADQLHPLMALLSVPCLCWANWDSSAELSGPQWPLNPEVMSVVHSTMAEFHPRPRDLCHQGRILIRLREL